MKYLILMLLSLGLIVGCESGDTMTKEDVKKLELLREVKPSMGDDKEYNLYAFFEFYDGSLDSEEISEGARQRDKYDELQKTLEMDNVNQLTLKTNSLNSEEKEILGIKELPTFLVLDESGIVLQSTDLDEVVTLINGDK
ncbi:hypothetical protein [Halalkalibacter sp. APA_J-10(15)]|uniref:hypothetical protein n=1 Tax=Halalkalibacter sp. APA_J-10(15) TaxID=2933805 RepID=UPI001FF65F9A|nr:hypothetical protein [Halalkalibacter sp. APA_J-10(15)]MCK0473241.1 hypothetical protein [Halalkalibacter sp. APA_J-10(15)]